MSLETSGSKRVKDKNDAENKNRQERIRTKKTISEWDKTKGMT